MGDYAQSDFDTLYRDNYNNLLRLAYRSTKDYHESEDLVDEAFVIYLQKSGTVHISNPRAYLIKIMSNLICNYLRLKMQKRTGKSQRLPVRFSKLDRAKLLAYRVECCGAIAETDLRGIA